MLQTTTGHHETRYPIAETLWILAGIILLLAFGDVWTLLVLAVAIVAISAAWLIHLRVEHDGKRHPMSFALPFIFAATAAVAAVLTLAAPAEAASIDSRFDICGALRNGTSLASIETTLEARGYSASNAGALTGITIRQQCPDQAAGVMAQIS
jgi:predicted PurR-regulated permease PerM